MSNRRALATKDIKLLRLQQQWDPYYGFPLPVYNYVCKNCRELSFNHVRGKCLFGASVFQASAPDDRHDLWMHNHIIQLEAIPRHRRVPLKQRKRLW